MSLLSLDAVEVDCGWFSSNSLIKLDGFILGGSWDGQS